MSWFFKSKQIQLAILVFFFMVGFVPYFFTIPQVEGFANDLTKIAAVVGSFAIVIALFSQWRRSLRIIREKRRGRTYHVYMLILMTFMVIIGFAYGANHWSYMWLVTTIVTPLGTVFYAILAFYMSSACARAFRARSPKAALLVISGCIVLLYQAPLTGTFMPGIEPYALFLTDSFGMALSRMYAIAIVLGAILLNIRMLTGKELAFLGFAREEA